MIPLVEANDVEERVFESGTPASTPR